MQQVKIIPFGIKAKTRPTLFDLGRRLMRLFSSSSKSKLGGCTGERKPKTNTMIAQSTTPMTGTATLGETSSISSIIIVSINISEKLNFGYNMDRTDM